MIRLHNCFLLSILLAVAASAQTFQVINADRPPKIDGRLTEEIWQGQAIIRRFFLLGSSGTPVPEQCLAWLAADQDALYVAVRCEEPFMRERVLKYSQKDEPVWQDDGIEIFLNPARTEDSYVQIIVSSAAVIMDGYCQSKTFGSLDISWDSGSEAAVHAGQEGWSMEVRIPFAQLPITDPNADWGIHLARNQRGRRSVNLTCLEERIQGFNDLERFAILKGLDLSKLKVSPLSFDFGECLLGQNSSSVLLKNWGQQTAEVRVAQGWQGEPPDSQQDVQIPAGEEVAVNGKWLLQAQDLGRIREIAIYQQGKLLQKTNRKITAIPEVFLDDRQRAFFHYPDQPLILEIPIQLAAASRDEATLEWSVNNLQGQLQTRGQSLLKQDSAIIRIYWSFAEDGDYLLQLKLHKNQQILGQATRPLRLLRSPWQ